MSNGYHYSSQSRRFLTPHPTWKAPRSGPPRMPASEKKPRSVLEIEIPIDDSKANKLLNDVFLPINPRFSSTMKDCPVINQNSNNAASTGHSKSWDDMVEEEECDENVDSNIIISQTPTTVVQKIQPNENGSQPKGFLTPPPTWKATRRGSLLMPASEKKPRRLNHCKDDPFHVIHKVPSGDSPYVSAKYVQLIDKDPSRAVSLFWSAINSNDRVDSALKDMAVVMKQLDRSDEAVEAIKSFRHLCPPESQESIDNILIDLYKQSGRIEEEVELLKLKLKQLEEDMSFGGKRTKMARSQGKRVHITVAKEYSRLLGNLAWAYMQKKDFEAADEHYRKALSIESDKNMQCNLAVCLMHRNKLTEAKFLLQAVGVVSGKCDMDESFARSYERASLMLAELESQYVVKPFYFQKYCYDRKGPVINQKSNNGASTELPYDKKGDLEWRSHRSHCNIAHTRPNNLGFPQAPYTQPQRYRRQGGLSDKWCMSSRKLSFESPSTRSVDYSCSTDPTPQMPEKSESDFPSDDTVYSDLCCKVTSDLTLEPSDEKATGHKKSWADMVEEEECDENMDSNIIISETPKTYDQKIMPNEYGYFTQPEKPVRRSLCLAENLNPANCSRELF